MSRSVRIQITTALAIPLLLAGLVYFDPGGQAFERGMRHLGQLALSLDRKVVP